MTAMMKSKHTRPGITFAVALAVALGSTAALAQTGSRTGSGAFATYAYGDGEEPGELKMIRRYLKQNRAEKAIATAREFVRFTENAQISSRYVTSVVYRYQALNALCVSLIAGGRTVEAIATCEAAIVLLPNRWQAINSLANAHYSAADFGTAIQHYRKAAKLAPSYGRARALVEHNLELAEKKN